MIDTPSEVDRGDTHYPDRAIKIGEDDSDVPNTRSEEALLSALHLDNISRVDLFECDSLDGADHGDFNAGMS